MVSSVESSLNVVVIVVLPVVFLRWVYSALRLIIGSSQQRVWWFLLLRSHLLGQSRINYAKFKLIK